MRKIWEKVREESFELSEKLDKLETFINSDEFKNIEEIQKALLTVQFSAMQTYLTCLITRWINIHLEE